MLALDTYTVSLQYCTGTTFFMSRVYDSLSMVFYYSFHYMDKSTLSNASILGIL